MDIYSKKERYERMLAAFDDCYSGAELAGLVLAYALDESYDKEDICRALKETERKKGW